MISDAELRAQMARSAAADHEAIHRARVVRDLARDGIRVRGPLADETPVMRLRAAHLAAIAVGAAIWAGAGLIWWLG